MVVHITDSAVLIIMTTAYVKPVIVWDAGKSTQIRQDGDAFNMRIKMNRLRCTKIITMLKQYCKNYITKCSSK